MAVMCETLGFATIIGPFQDDNERQQWIVLYKYEHRRQVEDVADLMSRRRFTEADQAFIDSVEFLIGPSIDAHAPNALYCEPHELISTFNRAKAELASSQK
jgi:hypothetical protein